MTTITGIRVHDIRFPTSLLRDGSDAMNKDGDYSAAYVVLDTDDAALAGYGFTFTIGRGNDLAVEAARQRALPLVGRDVAELVGDLGAVYRELASDSQLRWLGPEKGVVHLAMAAVMNALWDLAARRAGKPLWRLLVDMTPEELVAAADLRYLSDVLTREQAVALLAEMEPTRVDRIAELESRGGYPCYTTSAGWLGYSRRQAAATAAGGGRRGLPPREAQGGCRHRGRRASPAHRSRGHRLGRQAHDRREPGLGRPRGDRVGAPPRRVRAATGSRSRRARTTSSGMLPSARRSLRSGWPPASTG